MKRAKPLSLALLLLAASTPRPEAPVADAAMEADTEGVRALIEQGEDVNEPQGDGMTALHWAARNDDVPTAELLLYAGANLNAKTRIGAFTPLLIASRVGSADVMELLLQAGADPNVRTTTGGTAPLHFAAAVGGGKGIELLLEHGAEINARERGSQHTPLMFAAAYGRIEAAEALIGAGADVSLTNEVIDLAEREREDRELMERREKRVAFLRQLEREANGEQDGDEEAEEKARGEEEQEEEEEEQEEEAAEQEEEEAEQEEEEAQEKEEEAREEQRQAREEEDDEPQPLSYAQLVGKHGGFAALHLAAREGSMEVAKALVNAGADLNQVSEGDHTTPLLIAAINGHWDLAMVLLAHGADPNIASDAGATPLYAVINLQWAPAAFYPQPRAHLSQKVDYLDAMDALLQAGADPNARLEKHLWYKSYNFDLLGVNSFGATPFWRAAYGTDVRAMELLAAYGADPIIPTRKPAERRRGYRNEDENDAGDDGADPSGLPPVPFGGPSVTPLLAASGAGYGQGRAGNSHRHVPGGWLPAVAYLVEEHGLDVNARDHYGYNAVHHAAARGDNELILYLVEQGADVTAVSREGQTTADMANGPVQRISPFPQTVRLLESLGSENNNNCQSC